jgi:hypothetical protein
MQNPFPGGVITLRASRFLLLACLCLPAELLAQNWNQQSPAVSPSARRGETMVYDSVHHQSVLFGGVDASNTILNDTWVYNGTTWTNVTPSLPAQSPSARLNHSMVFDAGHGNVVLFGGCSDTLCSSPLQDTWIWNGSIWTQQNPAQIPSPRYGANMAYSSAPTASGVYLFSGWNGAAPISDMWLWTGGNWTSLPIATLPPAREDAGFSYDPVNQQLVLFGGLNGSEQPINDTWLFTVGAWTQANPSNPPLARSTQGQVWDPVRQRTVMFGGGGLNPYNDTWLWDGTNWTKEVTLNNPTGGFYVNLVYDIQHAQPLLFGGQGASGYVNETWTLGYVYTSSWVQVDAANDPFAPGARYGANAVTYNGGVLLFGGYNGSASLNDTWQYTGREWTALSSGGLPARNYASMVYDGLHSVVLLFGGESGQDSGPLNDTWTFSSGTWTQATPANQPSARSSAAMVYDGANHNVMLFGGSAGTENDTWIWDGNNWTQQTPATTPPGRTGAAIVFDSTRNQVVMFGGAADNINLTPLNDTWVWDGTNWTSLSPANSPPARSYASMVYDAVHGRVLLFGGRTPNDVYDTWQWDGVNWTQLSGPGAPTALDSAAAAFLPSSGFFLFGGTAGGAIQSLSWTFASPYVLTNVDTATLGVAYFDQVFDVSIFPQGGLAPYAFSDDGVPNSLSAAGLSLNTTTGVITGVSNLAAGKNLSYGITITDSQGQSVDLAFQLVTDNVIVFENNPPRDATAGKAYSYQLSAGGGTPPFSFFISNNPPWLSLNASTGVLSATNCTAPSSYNYEVGLVDSVGGTASGAFTINCNPAPLITNSSPLPAASYNTYYSAQLTTNAVYDQPGAAPFTWSLQSGSLPAGLSLGSNGAITGTPTAVGTTTFTVTFTDAWGATTSKQLQIAVGLEILDTQLATGNVGVPYPSGWIITAAGGTGSYTFQAANLPPGLTMNSGGNISGTPTTIGNYTPTFTATDTANNQGSLTLPLFVVQPGTNPEDWVQLFPAFSPQTRIDPSMFYDSVRGKLIMFGGGGSNFLGDTDSWDGGNWTNVSNTGPSARSGAAAAFDPVHQVGVLFGGMNNSGPLSDTWLWNGTSWSQASPTNVPTLRSDAMMAWDGTHIVLFGGNVGGEGELGDTWIWDGTNWTQLSPANPPHSRFLAGMTYDAVHNKAVMFGGVSGIADTIYAETWIWDGAQETWTKAAAGPPPAARDSMSLAFDAIRGQVVLFGGIASTDFFDTWTWNGTAWSQLNTLHNPGPRDYFGMAFDASCIVLFSGENHNLSQPIPGDTWLLQGPVVTGGTMPAGTEGVSYSYTPPEAGGVFSLTYVASGLPTGVSINPTLDAFVGIPTSNGTFSVTDTVIDGFGVSSSANLSLLVSPPTLSLAPTTLPNATAGANYNVQLSATGGVPNYTFQATGLPTGLTLNASNQIVGQCTASSASVMLKVTDSASNVATVGPLTVTCNPLPSITTTSPLPSGFTNTPYSTTIQMTGGTPAITWAVTAGNLPQGFSLSQAGVISGSTTSPIVANFSVTVTDIWNATYTQQFQLTLANVINFTNKQLPLGNVNVPYPGVTLAATGGAPAYSFFASNLPPGLNLNQTTGAITGTPTTAGNYNPQFTITDQDSNVTIQNFTIYVAAPGTYGEDWIQLSPAFSPQARFDPSVFYDSNSKTFIMFGGDVFTGLNDTEQWDGTNWTTLSPSNSPSARYGAAAAFDQVHGVGVLFGGQTNSNGLSNETWIWNGNSWVQANPATVPPARQDAMMAWDDSHIVMFGGSSNGVALGDTWIWDGTNWTQVNGAAPPARALAGIAYDAVRVQVVLFGGSPVTSNANFNDTWLWSGPNETWTQATPANSPSAREGVSMAFDTVREATFLFGGFEAPNNPQNDTWMWEATTWTQVTTPHSPSPRDYYLMAYNPFQSNIVLFGGTGDGNIFNDTWMLEGPFVEFGRLPAGTVNVPYSQSIPVPEGVPPLTYIQGSGTLPPGVNFNAANGSFAGTPTSANASGYPIFVTIQDAWGVSTVPQIFVPIDAVLTLQPSTLPNATAQTNYNVQLSATGGFTPYAFSASGLPAGLSINANNQIVGQCTASSANVMLKVTDSTTPTPNVATVGPLTVTCNPLPSITTTSPLPGGFTNTPYNTTIQMTGGTPAITWTLIPGNLPAGFSLSQAGVLTGNATSPIVASFSVKVTDIWNATYTQSFQLTLANVINFSNTQLPLGNVNVPYPGVTLVATGGAPAYIFLASNLPPGLSLNQTTGAISGTPTTAGNYNSQFTVTDQDSNVTIQNFPIYVAAAGTNTEDWVQLSPAFSPGARYGASTFYDLTRGKLIVFGGGNAAGGLNDTESWDGANWTTLSPAASPSPRVGSTAAFDPVHQQGVLFGGETTGFVSMSDTWLWNGTTWTQASPATNPPAKSYGSMAWDGSHIVLYGGGDGTTWTWDGANWTQVAIGSSPAARTGAGMAYDSLHNVVVMFGGNASGTPVAETWIWNGSALTWTQQTPVTSPQPRSLNSMAFDGTRGVVVLFGGVIQPEAYPADTWTWNGTTWTQLNTPHSPTGRIDYTMAFDAGTSNIVLFGGEIGFGPFANDTWILDGPYVFNLVLPAGTVNVPYSQLIPVSGGVLPLTYIQGSGAPPPGINFNAANGSFAGTPTSGGSYSTFVTIQDAWGVSFVPQIYISIESTLALQPATLPNATAQTNYNVQLSATGGIPAYTFSATGLPAGLAINANNQIAGQCTASSANVMLKVIDSASNVATVGPLSVTCNPLPSITTTSPLPDGLVNTAYSASFQSSGGTGPIAWSLTPGNLPSGFQLTGNQLTGTATSPVSATFSVTATDFWGAANTVQFTLNIESTLTITSTSLPSGVQGSAYPNGVTLGASGGTGSGTYTFSATGLPAGLQINASTGAITGIPGQAGIFQPIFTVTDQTPQTVILQIPIEILSASGNPNWTNLNPPSPPGARDSYAMAFDPVHAVTVLYGGTGLGDTWTFQFPGTWTQQQTASSPVAHAGAGLAWMASQNNLVLFGGQFVTGQSQTTTYNQTWVWNGTAWTQLNPATVPPARAFHGMAPDSAHNTVLMFGGTSGGGFANALNDTWVWDGTNWTQQTPSTVPTAASGLSLADGPTGPVLFGGLDPLGNPLNQTYVWNGANWILQSPIISPPARSHAGMVYDTQLGVTILFGGTAATGPFQDVWQWNGQNWTQLNPATVPSARSDIALSFDSVFNQVIMLGGAPISPQPSTDDTWTFGFPAVVNTTLPAETAGAAYNATIPIIGGTPPYSIQPTGIPQNFPAGLNLNAVTGQITGTTQAVGTYSIGIVVGDTQTGSTSVTNATLSLTVNAAGTLVLSPTALPDATASTNYSEQLSAVGGVTPYLFSATGLPAGLQINSSNQIVGQCTAGSNNVMLMVADSATPVPNGASVGPLTVRCNTLPTFTTTSPLTSGVVGTAYSTTLQMSGGTAPIAWTLGANTLPSGFQLSSSGVLTGTATSPVSATLNVTVTDFWGASATKTYTLNIYPVLSIATSSLPNGTAGVAYPSGISITPNGGTGSGTYGFSATGLPSGFSIDPSLGSISGTTAQTGLFTPTFKVTDQDAQVATEQINLTILSGSGLTILSPTILPTGASGQAYSYTLQWSGGVGTVTISATGLPAWLNLNSSTGALTGTPPSGGAFTFSITATDSQKPTPNTASQQETIIVNPPTITTVSPLPPAYIGIAYSQNLAANSGTSPYAWSATNLPAWLSLSNSGTLSGTPPLGTPASVTLNVTVTDSLGAYSSGSLTLPVLATPGLYFQTASPLPPGTPNVAYSAKIQAAGGNGILTLSASGLPNWLNFNIKTGALTGTPPSAGPVTFQITVSDNVPQSLTQYFTVPVNAALEFNTASPLPPASVGIPYSETLVASGGSGSYTWSAANLPGWLSLSAAGALTGTPPQAGAVTMRITVKDTQNNSISQTFTLPVVSALTIETVSPLPAATVNFPYTLTFAAAGGAGNYQWSSANLPSGFTLSAAGVLLGAPQAAAPLSFGVTVTDSLNNTATLNATLPVNSALTLNSTALPEATVQVPYNTNLTASGGVPGYTFTAAAVPAWLTVTKAGFLAGTPTSAGPVTIQVTVTDSQNNTATAPVTITVNAPLSITTASLPEAAASVAYSTTLTAAGGIPPYTWSSANLPNGLAISAVGVLSGTVAQPGSYPVAVTVWDSGTSAASQNFTLMVSIGPPLSFVTPPTLPTCVPNAACSNQIVAAGGVPPYTFSVPANTNLNGLSLSANGLLSGTPASGGPISVPVTLSDQVNSITRTFTQPVIQTLVILTNSLPNGTVGVNYGQALQAAGGQGLLTWSLAPGSGPLPAGLNLDSRGGNIFGTPTAAGTSTFSIETTDGQQVSQPQQLSLTIAPVPTGLAIASAQLLLPGTVGVAYNQTLAASGGSGSYSWTLTVGTLPAGLNLAPGGAISGTPTTAGNSTFTAKVTDGSGNSASSPFTITITSPNTVSLITPNPLPNGAVGVAYTYSINVAGGTPPYTFAITAGQLPPGLTFDSTNGTLTGTPTQKGAFVVTLYVTDSGGAPVGVQSDTGGAKPRAATSTNYIIQIAGPGDFQITTQSLPQAFLQQIYNTSFTAANGAAPYTWSLEQGTMPAGLTLTPGGSITGFPEQAGLASIVVKATDSTGASVTGAYQLQVVNPAVPAINPVPSPPPGTVGVAYNFGLAAVGGHTPYTWSILQGTLPPGIGLNAQSGVLSGTPTRANSYQFTAEVTDNLQVTATQVFTIRVNALTLTISPTQIPPAVTNVAYSVALNVSGGTAPYNWSLSAGGLLGGFAIDSSTGAITGTPTTPGTYPFTISVVDSNFGIATATFQLTVQGASISITTTSLPAGTVGSAYDFGLLASNATPPLTWSVVSGNLPPGIQLGTSNGVLSGTPTTAGSYTFMVQVMDSTSATATATLTLAVSPQPLTIMTTSLPGGSITTAYSQTVKSSGGTGAITWSVSAGSLPGGLSLSSTTGTISGTPSAPGNFSFTIEATDSTGVTAQQPFTVAIAGPPALPAITLSGLPATSKPADQPTVTIALASPYPLPITVTATLSITPNPGSSSDLSFPGGSRTTQITIPANTTTATLQFQVGTLPGTIEISLSLSAAGVNITPSVAPSATTTIAASAPTINSVTVTTTTTGINVVVVGTSTTLDMKTATFQFTPAAGANLQTTSVTIDVSSLFAAWYGSAKSLATGSQFSLTVPFAVSGSISSIASVSVTLTNSVGTSNTVGANVP